MAGFFFWFFFTKMYKDTTAATKKDFMEIHMLCSTNTSGCYIIFSISLCQFNISFCNKIQSNANQSNSNAIRFYLYKDGFSAVLLTVQRVDSY